MLTLDGHLRKASLIAKHRQVYRQLLEQKPKVREAFSESHRAEIFLFEAADQ